MLQTFKSKRLHTSAISLMISGVFFVLYPTLRPFSDETSLQGAAAFASPYWLIAHMLAMVAFTLLPLGIFGLHSSLKDSKSERPGYVAVVLSMIGVGFTLPFYGGEANGLHAIGQEALAQQNSDLLKMASAIRSGAGLYLFLIGLLFLAAAAIILSIALWRSGLYPKWSGVPFALGFALYIPQFFGSQPLRIAHGLLVTIGCLWIAIELWKNSNA